jgi:hypothetical protein
LKTGNLIIKRAKLLLIGLPVFISSLIFLYPQLFYCEMIRVSDFVQMENRIFVSPDIRSSQLKKIKKVISASEMRVDSFYSGKISSPIIIICSSAQEYRKYCSSTEGAGCSLGTPWGSSFIVLNTEGINVDVISHEMSHIELLNRLGWWKTTTQVPQWFNEGVALMLDKRFVSNEDPIGRYLQYMDEWLYYTRGGQEILELEQIVSAKGFFNGNQHYVMLAYMTSGMEISYWLSQTKGTGVQNLIRFMKQGSSFSDSYLKAEAVKKSKHLPKLPVNPLRLPGPNYGR